MFRKFRLLIKTLSLTTHSQVSPIFKQNEFHHGTHLEREEKENNLLESIRHKCYNFHSIFDAIY